MGQILFLLIMVSGILLMPPATGAEDCGPTLRIVGDEFGKYFYMDENRHWAGIDQDVINEVARRMDCKVEVEIESTIRIIRRFEAGTADIASHKFRTPEREAVAWMIPYVYSRNFALINRNALDQASEAAFMADTDLIVGVGKGWAHGPGYDRIVADLRKQGRVLEVADTRELFKMLQLNRVQAIFTAAPVYRSMLSKEVIEKSILIQDWAPNEFHEPVCLMLSKARFSADAAKRVERVVADMQSDGTMRRIVEKYLGSADTAPMMIHSPAMK